MRKLTKRQKEEIIKRIQEDKIIPDKYRFIIPFETEREYELTYAEKERKEDILADTLSVPFQPIKKFGEVKEDEWCNMLIFGDNLQALKHLLKLKEHAKLRNPDGRDGVKLIYIDPPFAAEQEFKGAKGEKAYQDKISGAEFLEFLRKRLIFLKELLTEDGCIYVHLDWRKGHYVKVLMDEIFEEQNFISEVVWHFQTQGKSESLYARQHATIYSYSKKSEIKLKTKRIRGNVVHIDGYNIFYPKKKDWGKDDYKGNIYYEKDGRVRDDVWTYQDHNVFSRNEQIKKLRNIIIGLEHGSKKRPNYWKKLPLSNEYEFDYDINAINSQALEAVGYPTQKPESLLHRIILANSEEGDIVLDAFAGSGTTLAVAEKLGRRWIGVDTSKLAIYTIQKRMLNLKAEIGNKGKALKPKPFVLYNAGLYQDSGFIEKMEEGDYKKFVLELFNAELNEHKIKGVQMHGILDNRPVMVFSQKDFLTYEFIEDLHKILGSALKDEIYIIVPQSVVRFNEDYVDKGKIRYYILKVPYSIIQKIIEKDFVRGLQPLSKTNINQTIESVGFDFIYPPKVDCEYYQGKEAGLFDQLVIKIKKFEPVQISKKPVEFKDSKKEALSMVLIDENYNGKIFDMDHYFFGDEIIKNDFKVIFPKQKVGQKIMIIYLDVLGNEKVEVKDITDFKKK